jgi:hypothetical protein
MPRTTPIHENCGTCTECARNPQIIRYTCRKGGSYKLLTGYVGSIDDVCIKPEKDTISTIIKCLIVGQVVGIVTFLIGGIPAISAAMCLGVSLITYLCNEY